MSTTTKIPREQLVADLVARDSLVCGFPGCKESLDLDIVDGPLEVTIDHWIPQHWGKANGWTPDEIWALSNLKLMHKKCNAKKGDRVPNADGTLPERVTRQFRYRREKRANRPDEPCATCDNGHNLGMDEVCSMCGCDAQRFPRYAKAKASECDHAVFWCAWCSIGVIPRAGATEMIMLHGEGGLD